MKLHVMYILSVCLLAAACKKRSYPEDKTRLEDENIFVKGSIGNEQVDLKIGTDGYYCYSSHVQRADSIYIFKGELKKFGCTLCTSALQIEVSDYRKRSPGASIPADSVFSRGSRSFMPALPRAYALQFASYSNKEIASVSWRLENGISSQDSTLKHEFAQPGLQTVSLTVHTKDNCESAIVNKMFISENGVFACNIATEAVQNNTAQFRRSVIGGKGPFRYTWNFGDGSSSDLSEPGHTYQWAGSYPVKLRIEDANGHICESDFVFVTGSDKSSCTAGMSLSYTGSRNVSLNGARIQWTDATNTVLKSDNIAQPAESYFEVINSQPYEPNEKGEAGRLLTVRFNVLLSAGNRKTWFKSENAAIAVTYK